MNKNRNRVASIAQRDSWGVESGPDRSSERRRCSWTLKRMLPALAVAGTVSGCISAPVVVVTSTSIPPGSIVRVIRATVSQDKQKCQLDLRFANQDVPSGKTAYWRLSSGNDPVTFDVNGIDISQYNPPPLPQDQMDFIKPGRMDNDTVFYWTANPDFSTQFNRSYTVNATWMPASGVAVACKTTDPIIVNRK